MKSHKVDGERITLTLRGGGEVTCDKTVIDKIEVDRRGAVRRAKLYYLRERKGKAARIGEKRTE